MNDQQAYRTHRMCAACRYMMRKCPVGCPLAPYFPVENTTEFQAVLRVFGVGNLTKMILRVGEADRRQLVESLVREAFMRERDPVLGIYREYARVLNELNHFKALANTNLVRILQLQSQIIRMRGDDNGNGNSMSVPSDHIEWHYGNCPVAYLGGAGPVAVTAKETYNNNPMAYARGSESCTIHGIPYTNNMQNHLQIKNDNEERIHGIPNNSNVQNHLQIKNDNQEQEVTSSATLPPNHPSSIDDDLTSSLPPQAHEGN